METRYDNLRKFVNPLLRKFGVELVKICSGYGDFIGIGIRKTKWRDFERVE